MDGPNDAYNQNWTNFLILLKICEFLRAPKLQWLIQNDVVNLIVTLVRRFLLRRPFLAHLNVWYKSHHIVFFVYIEQRIKEPSGFIIASKYRHFKMEVVNDRNPEQSGTSATFTNILVSNMDENGQSSPKYTFPVTLIAEYDPEVINSYKCFVQSRSELWTCLVFRSWTLVCYLTEWRTKRVHYSDHHYTCNWAFEYQTTVTIWLLDIWIPASNYTMGVWYSNGLVMWLGRPLENWTFWTINKLFQSGFQTTIWILDHLTTPHKSTIWILH